MVLEFEQALAAGERIGTGDPTYANLGDEVNRLRHENDDLMEEVAELNKRRSKLVQQEDAICRVTLESDTDFSYHEGDLVGTLGEIKEIDCELARLQTRHHQNIRDVGLLKRTMGRIAKMGEVMSLIDGVEASLSAGQALTVDGPEAAALLQSSEDMRSKYDHATQAVIAYRKDVKELIRQLGDTGHGLRGLGVAPSREADKVRATLVEHLQHMKRMLAQLVRLRDIQVFDTNEISVLERARAKLMRHSEIRELLKSGDKQKIGEEFQRLRRSTIELRADIKEMEAAASSQLQSITEITAKLRVHKAEVVTAESGLLREALFAVKDEEEQAREWLAVLRDVQCQNLQFLASLKAAM